MSEAPYNCPECHHPLEKHREAEAIGYACWHDVSPDRTTHEPCGCTYRYVAPPLATFYAIRHPVTGKYYKTYTKNSSSGWKDKLEDARLWIKLSGARSKITALSHGGTTMELVEFHVTKVVVVDQKERVAKAKAEKDRKEAERQAFFKAEAVKRAEQDLAVAQRRLEKLRRG